MSKIGNMIEGFSKPLPEEESWWQERMAKCGACEFNSLNGATLSIGCKTAKKMFCPSEEKGTCNQCCCCVEEKTSVKAESCPKGKWGAMTIATKDFKVEAMSNTKVYVNSAGVFVVDGGEVDGRTIQFEIETTSIKKRMYYENAKSGCGCTTTLPKEVMRGKVYRHKVAIDLSTFGVQNKSLTINFRDDAKGLHSVAVMFKFNRVKTNI